MLLLIYSFLDEFAQPSGTSVHSPTKDGDTRESEPSSSDYNEPTTTDEQPKKFLPDNKLKSSAIERDFMSPCGVTTVFQSNKYCSDEMVVSQNRLAKESELPKNVIWRNELVCGKLCTAKALHEEVTVIMITIATSLQ